MVYKSRVLEERSIDNSGVYFPTYYLYIEGKKIAYNHCFGWKKDGIDVIVLGEVVRDEFLDDGGFLCIELEPISVEESNLVKKIKSSIRKEIGKNRGWFVRPL